MGVDIAILQTAPRCSDIPLTADDYAYILNHSGATYCFVSDAEILQKINSIRAKVPALKVYSLMKLQAVKLVKLLLLEDQSNQNELEERKEKVLPEDLATIIYTPLERPERLKGLCFLTRILFPMSDYSSNTFPAGRKSAELPSCLSYFERAALYLYQYHGVSVYFGES
jgi:long-chain acyl-CoA synthetase